MGLTPGPRLTIGQAAAYAGVTTRAVRHYHQVGLLPEPDRDGSGYRRYTAGDVIGLIRIRALANAGVPLSRVGELLAADRVELAAAVTEIDGDLQAEIRRLEENRVAVAQLATIDGLAMPPEIVDYLDEMRAVGLSERMVQMERDGWLLIAAQLPDTVSEWIAEKRRSLDAPEVVAIYRGLDAAFDCEPGDPLLDDLADELANVFELYYAEYDGHPPAEPTPTIDDTMVAMLDAGSIGSSPAWQHVGSCSNSGWIGWNERFGPPSVIKDGLDLRCCARLNVQSCSL